MDFRTVAAGLALAAFALPAPAQRSGDADADEAGKRWNELEAILPGYPKTETLVPFNGGGASGHRFFIDEPSLSIGADGVVRYTLVVKTTGGATNVTYEGLRCEERHQKTYAVGQASGAWVRARDPKWRRIEHQAINNHHGVLYSDFLCQGKEPAKSPKEILQRMRYGPPAPS
jgi:hypothetical protein